VRLFEMEPDKLVDAFRPVLEPARDALVEVPALRLRQRRVGSVPDEDVVEAESALALPLHSEQALANAGQQMRVEGDLLLALQQVQNEFPRELRAADSGALQHRELAWLEAVEAAGEQRIQRWRQRVRFAALRRVRQQLLNEERVPASCTEDLGAQRFGPVPEVSEQRFAFVGAERAET
jgi:hypothetical protein